MTQEHNDNQSPVGNLIRRWIGWWLAATFFYLAIYGELTPVQALVGLAVGAMAAVLVIVAERLACAHFAPGWAWLPRFFWRVPRDVLRDCARILIATLRMMARQGVRGHFHAIPFDAGGNTPRDAARRAMGVLEISQAPNAFVINVDCEKRRLLLHQFLPSPANGSNPDATETPK